MTGPRPAGALGRTAALALTTLLVAGCTQPTAPASAFTPDPFVSLLAVGEARSASGARAAAEEAYRQAAADHPLDPVPYLRLAQLYLEWGRPEEGLLAVAAAERLGGPMPETLSLHAKLYAGCGDWEKAVVWGERAMNLHPSDPAIGHGLGQAYVALGRAAQAQMIYRSLLEANPADPVAHEQLGVLLALSSPRAALPHLRAAGTSLALDLERRLSQAEEDPVYRRAVVGQTCLQHGQPWLARLALEEAVARNPAYADAQALLGWALDRLGHGDEARTHLETAVRLAPESILARSSLGLHLLQMGDPAAGRAHLEAAYEQDPGNPALSLYLARAYAELGQYGVAAAWLKEGTRLAPQDADVWRMVVRFYLDRGLTDLGGGAPTLEEAVESLLRLDWGSAINHDLAGRACFLLGYYDQAQTQLAQAISLDPGLAAAYYHMGQVYACLGRTEEARAHLLRALDLNTDPGLRAEIETALDSGPPP